MSKSLAATFAREMRAARQARGWTQAELAERADIVVEVCGRLERGRVLPRADTLVRLATALGLSTDALLGLSSTPAAALARAVAEQEEEYAEVPELKRLVRRLKGESRRTMRLLDGLISSVRAERGPRRRD
ncbi:MAG TPA: helix-turn-helix transcriptional regulator [Anaeromyxobacter sp.]